jgi:hypothetical protein
LFWPEAYVSAYCRNSRSRAPGNKPSATVESITTTADLYGNPCDTMMGTMKGMSVMGESMEAMTNHMCITPDPSGAARRRGPRQSRRRPGPGRN